MQHRKTVRQTYLCKNALHETNLIKFKFENYEEKNNYKNKGSVF